MEMIDQMIFQKTVVDGFTRQIRSKWQFAP
jgi:hypothetical protein